MDKLIVSERFGPTFQGEGPHNGRRAIFLRLGMCNLDCAWCDTPYTWDFTGKLGVVYDKEDFKHESVTDVLWWVDFHHKHNLVNLLVITGGEPLLQRKMLERTVHALRSQMPSLGIEIETNGTRSPGEALLASCHFNVSPKLVHAKTTKPPLDEAVLKELAASEYVSFKFVVTRPADLDEVTAVVERVGIDGAKVWIMPEGRTVADITGPRFTTIADATLLAGYNLCTRLHVLAWGDERGR